MRRNLSDPEFEKAYELIAAAIDRAGESKAQAFLGKLCLTLAAQLDELASLKEAIRIAEQEP